MLSMTTFHLIEEEKTAQIYHWVFKKVTELFNFKIYNQGITY